MCGEVVTLSRHTLLIGFADLRGFDPAGILLLGADHPIRARMAWLPPGLVRDRQHLLLAQAVPALTDGQALSLHDEASGRRLPLTLTALSSPEALLGKPEPQRLLALLHVIAAKATGTLRQGEDAELAAACLRMADSSRTPERSLHPMALCGPAAQFWHLPQQPEGMAYLITGRRFQRLAPGFNRFLLLDREAEGGVLLLPGCGGPLHLDAAPRPLPSLASLARSKERQTRGLWNGAMAELVRRAPGEPVIRGLLRSLALQSPTVAPSHLANPAEAFSAGLEMALDDHGGGVFLRGWLRDPMGLLAGLSLRSAFSEHRLEIAALHRLPRPDLAKHFTGALHGPIGLRPGFVAHLPEPAFLPAPQWRLRILLSTGERHEVVPRPALLPAQAARDAVLSALPLEHLTEAMLDEAIAPAVARLHKAALAARLPPEPLQIGTPLHDPRLALVVPLYRNLRFLRPQFAAFARDPALAEAELIYVLDSPEQRGEVEHLLRGLAQLYRRPVTLVIQAANYGYASACNAGAAVARAPVLLMLNSDVVPAARGWSETLLAALDSNPAMVAVGPKLLFDDGALQHAGLFFERYGPWAEFYNNHYAKGMPRHFPPANRPRLVPGITGAAFCVRRGAFESVGGFSTDYVIGDYEDSDLSLKLRAAGGEIGYEPRAELYHFERQSIRSHATHDRGLATAYNRRLHQRRWGEAMESLMARPEFSPLGGWGR